MSARSPSPSQLRTWLASAPTLDALRDAYPAEWQVVRRELGDVVETGDRAALTAYAKQVASPPPGTKSRPSSTRGLSPESAELVRRRMAAEAIKGLAVRAATGVHSGTVRFGVVQGTIIQRLLFRDGLERRPAPLWAARLLWPLLSQRRRLMTLVQPKGIYCFYSGAFVRQLAKLIDSRSCLEIAAGDGTLARFLTAEGAPVIATDDHSWSDVAFPADVEHLDARAALRVHRPAVVLCAWPPADNSFEAAVFRSPTVQTYVVIGNRQLSGWGDHGAYAAAQPTFRLTVDDGLARRLLPPELESVVYVFERETREPGSDDEGGSSAAGDP